FESTLQCHTVNNGGKHTHIISLDLFDAGGFGLKASVDIAAANDNGHFHAHIHGGFDFGSIMPQLLRMDAESLIAHQRFTAKLQNDAFVTSHCFGCLKYGNSDKRI